jgi:hypothetical protein
MRLPRLSVELSHSPVAHIKGATEERVMTGPNSPGPGRSTAEAALNEVKKEVARRNEEAHKVARKARTERDRQQLLKRREQDRD